MMKKSKRSDVDPFIVMDVMESARIAEEKGKDIIHMEVGQPGTPAPKIAKDYITNEINKNNLGYTCLLYTSPSPRDDCPSRMPSSA